MTNPATTGPSDSWHIDGAQATLCTPLLTASVDLLNPSRGLHRLEFIDATIAGPVLGICPGMQPIRQADELSDRFVRGDDLVATYSATAERPFSLQVYWRAIANQQGVQLDVILSLQTDLLESFPGVAVETMLPGGEHCSIPLEGAEADLIRPAGCRWSYAESTHPDDLGESQVEPSDQGEIRLARRLGGRFLEKGVIRRIRVRGIFLPRQDDEMAATECLQSFTREEPPLTV